MENAKQIQESIREILLRDWDPIGVQHAPEAQDEYDGYVSGVYRLLAAGATEKQILDHLWHIETDAMGLSVLDPAKLAPAARKLRSLSLGL